MEREEQGTGVEGIQGTGFWMEGEWCLQGRA